MADIETADIGLASVLESLKASRRMLQSQMDEVFEIKVCATLLLLTLITIISLPMFGRGKNYATCCLILKGFYTIKTWTHKFKRYF